MPPLPLPNEQIRARWRSPQCKAWLASPNRTAEQLAAYEAAEDHLKHSRWAPVRLATSFMFTDYYTARLSTGEFMVVRFAMIPPVAGVYILFVGTEDETADWRPDAATAELFREREVK